MNIHHLELFYYVAKYRGVSAAARQMPYGKIESHLRSGTIDIGLATCSTQQNNDIRAHELLKMPLVLLVPEHGGPATAPEILDLDRIDLPLINLPSGEPTVVAFQQELQRRKIEWFPMLELASIDLVARSVAAGYGSGLALEIPGVARPPGIRALPLPGFLEISFHALTLGNHSPLMENFISEAEKMLVGLR